MSTTITYTAAHVMADTDELRTFGTFGDDFYAAFGAAMEAARKMWPEEEGYEYRQADPFGVKWQVYYNDEYIALIGVYQEDGEE